MKGIRDYFSSVWFALGFSFRFVPRSTALMGVMNGVVGVLPYLNAFILGKLVNNIVDGAQNGQFGNVWQLVFLYAFLGTLPALFSNLLMYVNRYRMLTLQMETDLSILKRREEIDIARYEDPKFQDLIQRTFRNGPNPTFQLSNAQFDLIRAVVGFAVGTTLSINFSPWVYFLVIGAAVPAFFMDIKYAGKAWSIWAKDSPEQRRLGDLRQHITSRYNLIETKLLQSGEKLFSWMRKIFVDFSDIQRKLEKNRVWQNSAADLVAFLGFAGGLVLIVRSVMGGESSVGTLVYMMGTLGSVRNSIANLLETISGQYENHLVVQDLKEFMETKPVITETKEPRFLDIKSAPEIVFEKVSFKYFGSDTWSLRHLSLTMRAGDKIGLVGNNGAGKTTFVKLLCRIYDPTEGRILVNGVDLREISIKEWWSYLGVMFQDYATYDFKAKEAIAIGRPSGKLDMNRVRESAQISQASGFIEQWKDGFDQQIGVEFSGVEPSKGQRQKLSIAKVIYRDARIMILDEPTASVDAESEAKIFNSLENLSKDTTALLISHDFSTISQCDQIFVLEEGKLIEEGNHKELMKHKGKYAELYDLQAERFRK